jgi:uncharacterized membrane protein
MDIFGALFNLIFVLLIIYGVSRLAQHLKDSKNKLDEMDKKLDEIKELYYQENKKK